MSWVACFYGMARYRHRDKCCGNFLNSCFSDFFFFWSVFTSWNWDDRRRREKEVYNFQNIISSRINLLGVLSLRCWCWLFSKLRGITTNLLNNVSECLPVTATVCLVFSFVFETCRFCEMNIQLQKPVTRSLIIAYLTQLVSWNKEREIMFNSCRFLIPVFFLKCQNRMKEYCNMLSLRYTPTLNFWSSWCFFIGIPTLRKIIFQQLIWR